MMTLLFALLSLGFAQQANAQNFHGLGANKTCGAEMLCDGSTTECFAQAIHLDTAGDALLITGAFDRIDPLGMDIRVPAVGSLPISGIFGNAAATVGGGGEPIFPVLVGPPGSIYSDPDTGLTLPGEPAAGFVQVVQNQYVIDANDPSPLLTQTIFTWFDECDSGAGDCPDPNFEQQTPAAASLVLVDPGINLEKTADLDPARICAGTPTEVTYTYTVTNTGDADLESVVVTDSDPDCNAQLAGQIPMGDTDGDNELDLTETWTYQCVIILTEGTTNTAQVTASAVMSSANCTAFDDAEFTITTNQPPTCTIDGPNAVCEGTINMHCAAAGFASYAWTITGNGTIVGPADGNCVDVMAGAGGGSYTLTLDIVDDNGCEGMCEKTVTVNTDAICTIDGPNAVCEGTMNLHCAEAGFASYSWSIAGNGAIVGPIDGQCVDVAAGAGSGSYTLTLNVVDTNGCPGQCTALVDVNADPTCNIDGPNAVCESTTNQHCGEAGFASYSWSIAGNAAIVGATDGQCVDVQAGAGAGSYTLTLNVIDNNGCPGVCTKTVTVNANPTCNIDGPNAVCEGTTNQHCGEAGFASYAWTIAGNAAIVGATDGQCVDVQAGAGAGSYTLTLNVVDTNGCPGVCTKTVTVNANPTCNIDGPSAVCEDTTNGHCAEAGFASYSWSIAGNGTIVGATDGQCVDVLAGAGAGSYTLTLNIVDDNGCPGVCTKTVAVNADAICNIDGPNAVCEGTTNEHCGDAGFASYSWSIAGNAAIVGATDGQCVDVLAGAGAGSYTLTLNIVDNNGCPGVCTKTVAVNANPTCNIDGPNAVCEGTTNQHCGEAGFASYSWSIAGNAAIVGATDGQCVDVLAGAGAGSYTLTLNIVDNNGCPGVCTKTVTVNANPTCNIDGPNAVCEGTTNQHCGEAGFASYAWSIAGNAAIVGATDGQCVDVLAGAGAGSYTLTLNVVDDNGCPGSCTKTVTVNANPTCNIDGPNAVCEGTTNEHCGEAGFASYSWSIAGNAAIVGATDGQCVDVLAGAGAGSYTLTLNVVDTNGCPGVCTKTVTVNANPTCNIDGPSAVCEDTTNGHCAEAGFASYSWSLAGNGTIVGATDGQCVDVQAGAGAGSYTLTLNVVDNNGCPGVCTKTVAVNANLTCNIDGPDAVCESTMNQHCGEAGFASYSWSISGNGTIVGPTDASCVDVEAGAGAGSYTLTLDVLDDNGCPGQCTKTVTVNANPTCNIDGPDAVCEGTTNQHCGEAGFASYAWSIAGNGTIVGATDGQCVDVLAGAGAGSYTLTLDVIDDNGCPGQCTKTVTVNANPTCNIDGLNGVCEGTTNQHCGEAGFASYSWTISGNGTIAGAADGQCVDVLAGAGSGSYTLTLDVVDDNGCPGQCTKTVAVNANPVCDIDGLPSVCEATTNQHCGEAGFASYAWSIAGNGTIVGATDGQCVDVMAGSGAGSYTLTLNIVDDNGCPGQCMKTVEVNANATCIVDGPVDVCEGTTNTYCGEDGFASYGWSIIGDGVIVGPNNGQCVDVQATGPGSYTLTLDVTDVNGCPGQCTKDVAVICCSSIGDYVWLDLDRDGCQDVDEPGIAGVTVTLSSGCDVPRRQAMTTTDANGFYQFTDLCAGEYRVTFIAPDGLAETTPNASCDGGDETDSDCIGGFVCVDLPANTDDFTIDCGYVCTGRIGDYAWLDLDRDGCQDPNEPGIAGVTVTLFTNCADPVEIGSTTTDANGFYEFAGLCGGMYRVEFSTPAGLAPTIPNASCDGGDDNDSDCVNGGVCVDLPEGANDDTIDCGYVCTGRIGDFAWLDLDGDGCQDPDEPGLPDVEVTLYTNCADPMMIGSTFTDFDGFYEFTGLCAGEYRVVFTTPDGLAPTIANAACDGGDDMDSDCADGGVCIDLPEGGDEGSIDCGYVCIGRIGDYVWNDLNLDGCQDVDEPGIGGVAVTLYAGCMNPVEIASTVTNASGYYEFNGLCGGQYLVQFTAPGEFVETVANAACGGGDENDSDCVNGVVCVTLAEGEENLTIDCGLYEPSGGGEGCTPGYWKQSQHFFAWTDPYDPNDQFSEHFENAFPGKTLLRVLSQPASSKPGPNSLNSLGRHTVAALLNAASANVDYDFTVNDVINLFNAVYPGSDEDYLNLKNMFQGSNESGCPIGNGGSSGSPGPEDGATPKPQDPANGGRGSDSQPGPGDVGPPSGGTGTDGASKGGAKVDVPLDDTLDDAPGFGEVDDDAKVFLNTKRLAPADHGGLLEIGTDFVQNGDGVLVLEIRGLEPIVGYDVLEVRGRARLGGGLEVRFTEGFVPSVGDRFEVVRARSVAGAFDAVSLPVLRGDDVVAVSYESGAVVLEVRPAPAIGDLNRDAIVDYADLMLLMAQIGEVDSPADLDGDGVVGALDMAVLLENWGRHGELPAP